MNEVVRLLRRQVLRDLHGAPAGAARRLTDAGRAGRYGTLEEVRRGARRALPRVIFDFVDGAAGDEVTAAANRSDLDALALEPRVLVDVSKVDLTTSVLGSPAALPLIGAPMGLTGLVHPGGELALARALHREGCPVVLAAMASCSIEEVAAGDPGGPVWFQIYAWRDRGFVRELIERARAAGHLALVVTVDVPVPAGRDRDRRNGFGLPPRAGVRTLAGAAVRPRWSARFVRRPRMRVGNAVARGGGPGDTTSISAYIAEQFDPAVSWADLDWFRGQWEGPLLVKGVLREQDAREAVQRGADGIIVSNHGGRQLDHAPSAIGSLPAVAAAVGDGAEVYVDGGIRRGADVVKALAAGARACLIGRPLAYGLGVAGEAGAARVIEILRDELRTAMALAGCPAVTRLDPSYLRAPRKEDIWEPAPTTIPPCG